MLFSKMHGLGNDFILINGFKEQPPADLPALARQACQRSFGIGADGLIILSPQKDGGIQFSIYNADGSQAEMCGNGIRCAAIFAREEGLSSGEEICFSTLAGPVTTRIIDQEQNLVRVNMGKPRLLPKEIPADFPGNEVIAAPLIIGNHNFAITLVSMGNPHCVIFVPDAASFPVAEIGPQIEHHPSFPARTNVEFVEPLGEGRLKMRVWERGCGETLACGTGACASLVAAVLNGRSGREAEIELQGGVLQIKWLADNSLELTGPAVLVFRGEYQP